MSKATARRAGKAGKADVGVTGLGDPSCSLFLDLQPGWEVDQAGEIDLDIEGGSLADVLLDACVLADPQSDTPAVEDNPTRSHHHLCWASVCSEVRPALLFDLDDTLVVEEPAAAASFRATAQVAAANYRVDAERLALAARERARELWYAAPTHPYCMRIGISSWEGLWCRFQGEEPDVRWLREWSPRYRREAWRLALADQGVEDADFAEALGERFGIERRERLTGFADAAPSLRVLRESYALALVTNGASCLQREKLAASGLDEHFEVVVVSAELGIAKPDATIFKHALSQLGADANHAVMVGDSLARDVDGAIAAGLQGVWINRHGRSRPDDRPDLVEISTLGDLPAALGTLPGGRS